MMSFVFLVAVLAAVVTRSSTVTLPLERKPAAANPTDGSASGAAPSQVDDEQAESPINLEGETPARSTDTELDLGTVWTDFLMSQIPNEDKKPTKLEVMKARRRRKISRGDEVLEAVLDDTEKADPRSIDELLEGLGDVKMARQDSGVSTGRSATKKKRMKNRSFERTGEETPAGKGSPMGETSPEAADGDGASTVSVSTVSVEVTPASADTRKTVVKGGEGDTAEDSWQRPRSRKEKKERRDSTAVAVVSGRGSSSDPPSPSGEAQNAAPAAEPEAATRGEEQNSSVSGRSEAGSGEQEAAIAAVPADLPAKPEAVQLVADADGHEEQNSGSATHKAESVEEENCGAHVRSSTPTPRYLFDPLGFGCGDVRSRSRSDSGAETDYGDTSS